MRPKPLLTGWLLLLSVVTIHAQKNRPQFKFGDVKPEDFAPAAYAVDSSAEAVYLFDAGNAAFEGNAKGFFSVIFKRHARIRLLHKNAFGLATVEIKLYGKDKNAQLLERLEAATYNLEGGKVVATPLDKKSVFNDKNPEYTTAKFTFPNIKEGSIVEFNYTVVNPGYSYVPTWYYQGDYPRLYSEYQVTIPELLDFAFVRQGYHPYIIDTAKISTGSYNFFLPGTTATESSTSFSWRGNTVNSIWAMKDVPALKKEAFTTTLNNHVAKIEFQLSAIRLPDQPVKNVMHTWFEMSTELMKDEDFGAGLTAHNGWLSDELQKIQAGITSPLEKARKIFEYVRDNFTCTDDNAIYLSQPLKKVFQSRKGNVADINLLLTAMYLNQGWDAKPVLLSTRNHGIALETYPILNKFNYVISRLQVDSQYYLLDASEPELGFGHLSNACYNGSGRIIDPVEPLLVTLSPDSLKETRVCTVFMMNDTAKGIMGSYTCTPGYYTSMELRKKLHKEKEESIFNDIKKGFSYDVSLTNSRVDSLKTMEEPVVLSYDMQFNFNNEELVYFNPVIDERYKENPFKSAERYYPVEMPYCIDQFYVFNMDIPAGYKIDELPKSARVKLNETDGLFEYVIATSAEKIQLRCRVKLNKANFQPEDYQTLRDFFAYVVKKENEQIVFKKIN